jgi:hypothetical protein
MKIRFITSVAGANFAYRPKQVIDLRIDLARGFIKAGVAVEHVEERETATVTAPETATARVETGAPRGRRRSIRNLGGLLPQ